MLIHCWWKCTLVQPLWKTTWRFLNKIKIELPFNLAIPLLGIYPKEKKPFYQSKTCTYVYHSTIHKSKHMESTYVLNNKNYIYIHIHIFKIQYYSSIEKNTIMSFAATLMELEAIILNEITQKQKVKYCMFSLTRGS